MNNTKFRGKYRIESARLKDWDYSSDAAYFVTICVKNREHFFGEIADETMQLSKIGQTAQKYWLEIPNHFLFIVLGEFIIMPNHVHGIITINNAADMAVETRHCLVSTTTKTTKNTTNHFQNHGKHTISSIIGSYKSICTKTINKIKNQNLFAWQPRFYDHVIRDENDLIRIREYIKNNPINWANDPNNVETGLKPVSTDIIQLL